MIKNFCIFSSILLIISVISSCNKDNIFSGENANLSFSVDTLTFDTVFTTVGSATKYLKIFNPNEEDVVLDRIYLDEGQSSKFRLNINGLAIDELSDVTILGRDSIYIFAEVTVDPDAPVSVSPFVIEEFLNIDFKNESYQILLEAWGQNANYITGRDAKGVISILSCDMQDFILDDPKPYVLHGILVVDSCNLVIPEGTQIYVHGGIAINDLGIFNDGRIIISANASLQANGSAEAPIIIQGDRLEEEFSDVPGQWVGIIISAESSSNSLRHTIIKNSNIGMLVDSSASLTMNAVEIANTSGPGIVGRNASILANNTLVYNNGTVSAQLQYGGNYGFSNCTFYNDDNDRQPALYLSNYNCLDDQCMTADVKRLSASFTNCIIAGTNQDEINLDDWNEGMNPDQFSFNFEHCMVSIDELLLPEQYPEFLNESIATSKIEQLDSIFIDRSNYDLRLDTMSVAIDQGKDLFFITEDIRGFPRSDVNDLGCYEHQK